jgi:hypothetical protein
MSGASMQPESSAPGGRALGDRAPGDRLEFIVAGHSHMFALGAAYAYEGPIALAPVDAAIPNGYFLMEPWSAGRGAAYWDALAEHARDRVAVLLLHGNQHYAHFVFAPSPLFDVVDPHEPNFTPYPGAVLVPRRQVKASPLLMPAGLRDMILRLKAEGAREVIVSGTPPVREDFVDYTEELRTHEQWAAMAAHMGMDITRCQFTPAPVMRSLWGVMQEIMSDEAHEAGAVFLPVPPTVLDPHGYLAAPYRGPLWNFTHANEDYGKAALPHIAAAVAALERSAA